MTCASRVVSSLVYCIRRDRYFGRCPSSQSTTNPLYFADRLHLRLQMERGEGETKNDLVSVTGSITGPGTYSNYAKHSGVFSVRKWTVSRISVTFAENTQHAGDTATIDLKRT
jgi:hypothetical protein